MKTRRFLCWVLGAVSVLGMVVVGTAPQELDAAPLPQLGDHRPSVLLLLDKSGSMNVCDAGAEKFPTSDLLTCGNGQFSRMTAAKYAIGQILDADKNGVIDTADEAVLGIDIGFAAYTRSGDAGTSSGLYAFFPSGTSYSLLWCGDDGSGSPDCDYDPTGGEIYLDGMNTDQNGSPPGIEDLLDQSDTPTAPAMRAIAGSAEAPAPLPPVAVCENCPANTLGTLMGCYDGNVTTTCDITGQFAANGDDRARNCRDKYLIVLTDGASDSCERPPDAADYMCNGTVAGGVLTCGLDDKGGVLPAITTFGIAFGTGADRSEVNCIARLGGTDADLDGDGDPNTPFGNGHVDGWTECRSNPPSNQISAAEATANSCPNGNSGSAPHYPGSDGDGNGYLADDVDKLTTVLSQIFNSVSTGFFSRSLPAAKTPSVEFANAPNGALNTYGAFFEVKANQVLWEGSFDKQMFGEIAGTGYTGFVHCDDPTNFGAIPAACQDGDPSTPCNVRKCYQAGYNLQYTNWSDRNVFMPLPTVSNVNDDDFADLGKEGLALGYGTIADPTSANLHDCDAGTSATCPGVDDTYLVDMVALANTDMTAFNTAVPVGGSSVSINSLAAEQQHFVAAALAMTRVGDTYVIDPGNLQQIRLLNPSFFDDVRDTLRFALGHPFGEFGDGSCRGLIVNDPDVKDPLGAASAGAWIRGQKGFAAPTAPVDCSTGTVNDPGTGIASWKLGDIFESKPTVVTPPFKALTDPDHDVFRTCDQASCPGVAITGANYSYVQGCRPGVSAPCAVKDRLRIAITSDNSGFIHAWVDEVDSATDTVDVDVMGKGVRTYYEGDELWAISLYHMLQKHDDAQTAHVLNANNDIVVQDIKMIPDASKGGDGKWHTVVFITYKQGGPYMAALDITDPANPRTVWERRMGAGTDKSGSSYNVMSLMRFYPENISGYDGVFRQRAVLPGGVPASGTNNFDPATGEGHLHVFSFDVHDPNERQDKHLPYHQSGKGLDDSETIPPGIPQHHTGSVGIVDLNFDGVTERGYFGDFEGVLWKMCVKTGENDKIKVHEFADPAYFGQAPPIPLVDYEKSNRGGETDISVRGPVFYPPVVGRIGQDKFAVAFGTGHAVDPLNTSLPYTNHVWTFVDFVDSTGYFVGGGYYGSGYNYSGGIKCADDPSCCPAQGLLCNEAPYGSPANPSSGASLPNIDVPGRIQLNRILTGPMALANGILFFSEFEPDPNPANDICIEEAKSRLRTAQIFPSLCIESGTGAGQCDPDDSLDPDCGPPIFDTDGDGIADAAAIESNVLDGGIVSGPIVDPATQTVFVQIKGETVAIETPGLPGAAGRAVRNWRQR